MAKKSPNESEEKPAIGSVQSPKSPPHKEVQSPSVVARKLSPNSQLRKENQKVAQEEPGRYLVFCQHVANRLRLRNFKHVYLLEMMSEFLGIFVLVVFGLASTAQGAIYNNFTNSILAWGIAVALGVFIAGGCSGGHVNPAVTLTFAIFGRIPWLKVPFYFAGQYLGAFFGAALVYLRYFNQIIKLNKMHNGTEMNVKTAKIFATYPDENTQWWECLIDQIVSTGFLVLMIMAITDERNMQVPKFAVPFAIGFCIMGLVEGFGMCGGAYNPARDLSPRIFTAMAGWGGEVFSYRNYKWFWVPVVGPHIGALIGACFYTLLVSFHWPKPVEPKPVEQKSPEPVEH